MLGKRVRNISDSLISMRAISKGGLRTSGVSRTFLAKNYLPMGAMGKDNGLTAYAFAFIVILPNYSLNKTSMYLIKGICLVAGGA